MPIILDFVSLYSSCRCGGGGSKSRYIVRYFHYRPSLYFALYCFILLYFALFCFIQIYCHCWPLYHAKLVFTVPLWWNRKTSLISFIVHRKILHRKDCVQKTQSQVFFSLWPRQELLTLPCTITGSHFLAPLGAPVVAGRRNLQGFLASWIDPESFPQTQSAYV